VGRRRRAAVRGRASARRYELALAIAACGLACAHATPIESTWAREAQIAVDGAYADWSGQLVRIDSDRSVALGVANDRSNLYLCLVTRDLDVQTMIERAGFTLWIDPDGGRAKRIGFRIAPVQATAAGVTPPYVEIVRHGAEYGEQLVGSAEGPIQVVIAARADVIAYEMRLALDGKAGANALAVGAALAPGATVGLGVETEPFTPRRRARMPVPQEMPEPPPPDDPRAPRDPRAGGDYEDVEPMAPMTRVRKIEPLRAWVVTRLASRESP
jgi:hypothetical protein